MQILDPVHIMRIDAAPAIAAETILTAIRREAVNASLLTSAPRLSVSVPAPDLAAAARIVGRALERVGIDGALPLVPDRLGPHVFALRPPAG